MHPNAKNLIGQRFTRLLVIEETPKRQGESIMWKCKCDCGNTKNVRGIHLVQLKIKSCGCLQKEIGKTHGMSGSAEYKAWRAMQNRCSPNANNKDRKNYYERGIIVFDGWIGKGGFEKFFEYIGVRPSNNHSIDRINNNGNYEPGNIRWANRFEQINNRTIKRIENFSDEEMIQEMNRRGFRVTKTKNGKKKTD